MQAYSNPSLVREFEHIVDALGEISASAEILLTSQPKRATPALRELEHIVGAVGEITASVRKCFDIATSETVPDTFPAEWAEGGDES